MADLFEFVLRFSLSSYSAVLAVVAGFNLRVDLTNRHAFTTGTREPAVLEQPSVSLRSSPALLLWLSVRSSIQLLIGTVSPHISPIQTSDFLRSVPFSFANRLSSQTWPLQVCSLIIRFYLRSYTPVYFRRWGFFHVRNLLLFDQQME